MRLPLAVAALLAALISPSPQAEPQLLASIRPLQLIAIAVTGDPTQVDLLIDPLQSHHDYQLRPSDRLRLQRAELVLWVGPTLEGFLRQPLAMVEPQRVLMFGADVEPDYGQHDHYHGDPDSDGHLWLDPQQAIAMAQLLAARLTVLAPAQQQRWQRNSERFAARLQAVDEELKRQLAALPQRRGYLVLHDAYGHFERHYALQRTATFAATPEQLPGARHLQVLQRQLDAGRVGCVLTEPQYEPRALQTMLADRDVQRRQLDLMAVSAPLTPDGFAQFFEQFGAAFIGCLRP